MKRQITDSITENLTDSDLESKGTIISYFAIVETTTIFFIIVINIHILDFHLPGEKCVQSKLCVFPKNGKRKNWIIRFIQKIVILIKI